MLDTFHLSGTARGVLPKARNSRYVARGAGGGGGRRRLFARGQGLYFDASAMTFACVARGYGARNVDSRGRPREKGFQDGMPARGDALNHRKSFLRGFESKTP